ncbi:MAG: spore gernimation protein [Peptococcaceae bacterium]|nr:MAG: spore gernimation protein [Peptococcaceae bacterium]
MKPICGTGIKIVLILITILALGLFTGCSLSGLKNVPDNVPDPENQVAPSEQKLNVAVYYVKMSAGDSYLVREVHEIPYTREVARAALVELIDGAPKTPGAFKVLPPATAIRGVSIRNGLAVVDFSREVLQANVGAMGEILGIQSIVNTLSEFPAVQKVSFLVDGKLDPETRDWWGHVGLYRQPFTRDLSRVYEPKIWVTKPVPGEKINDPVEIKGSAMVFEGTVNVRLKDEEGKVLATGFATASEGMGRGDFELNLPFAVPPAGKGSLEVFWASPKDGSELDKVVIPVNW